MSSRSCIGLRHEFRHSDNTTRRLRGRRLNRRRGARPMRKHLAAGTPGRGAAERAGGENLAANDLQSPTATLIFGKPFWTGNP